MPASKRKAIGKKVRFEVFKRDGFKCQYCGAMAPDVVLEVDHIEPVSAGGDESILNYVTACKPCNAGKGARKLDDSSAVKKQQAQLSELHAKREQLEWIVKWRDEMKESQLTELDIAVNAWNDQVHPWRATETGRRDMAKLVKKFGLPAVLDAIDVVVENYCELESGGEKFTAESIGTAWKKIGGVCAVKSRPEEEQRLYYVKGILRNRVGYMPNDAMHQLLLMTDMGMKVEELERLAKRSTSWWSFMKCVEAELGVEVDR